MSRRGPSVPPLASEGGYKALSSRIPCLHGGLAGTLTVLIVLTVLTVLDGLDGSNACLLDF